MNDTIHTTYNSNYYLKVNNEITATTNISLHNAMPIITNSGVTTLNSNTGALTMDTGYISNFYSKVRSLYYGTAPIIFNSTTVAIGIIQDNTSTNVYLIRTV